MKPHTIPRHLQPVLDMAAASLAPLARGYDLTPAVLAELVRRGPAESATAEPAVVTTPVEPGKLLSVRAAAARLGCSRSTIFTMVRQGRLPRVLLGRRSARIPEAVLAAMVDQGTRGEGPAKARREAAP
jgi:excisionase family DNA binding protein